jgi:type I restriction enzyme S subunit
MNPAQLLAHFDRLAEAPEAIPRLRRFILDLAVRGKLVEQDPSDEPASKLLARIDRLRKHRRNFATLNPAALDAQLPQIPKTWIWTVVDQVAADDEHAITDGPFGASLKTEHYVKAAGFRVIRLQNIGYGSFRDEYHSYIDANRFQRLSKHHVFAGDVVVAGLVDPQVRCCEVPADIGPALVKADCYRFAVHPEVLSRFTVYYLNSSIAQEFTAAYHHGMTLTRIGLGNFRNIPFPLPPFAEQRRIVAKVDELMGLCDRLATAQAEREQRRDRLAAASLNRLNRPDDDAKAFRAHARFHLCHLPRLTVRPDQIPALRQTILNLAVQGKLVRHDPNDEAAEDWLRTVTKSTPSTEREIGESRFPCPESWIWLRVADVFEVAGGIQKTPHRAPRSNAFPYLGVSNVYRGRLDLTNVKEFELEPGELERRRLEPGDLLIIEGNGSFNEIGRCAKWNGEIPHCVHQNHVIRCRPCDVQIASFILLFLNSPKGMEIMQRLAITSSGLYSLSVGKIRQIEIPIPPLAEQSRIVAKVDELMAVCDRLESQLTTTQTESRRLLETVLHEALAPTAGICA